MSPITRSALARVTGRRRASLAILLTGVSISVLSLESVSAAPAAPKPGAPARLTNGTAFEENVTRTFLQPDARSPKTPKVRPERTAKEKARIKATADAHRGRISAKEARALVAELSPSLVASDAIVPDPDSVSDVIAANALRIKTPTGKRAGVVMSNLPLAINRGSDTKPSWTLADLAWKRDGDRLRVTRPVIASSLPTTAAGQIQVGDVGVTLANPDAASEGVMSGEAVTYPNVDTDQDLIVRSTPVGIGAGWSLRSPAASRVIKAKLDLPQGMSLKKDESGAVQIAARDGSTHGAVSVASARDADSKPVALSTAVEGSTITYTVDHAEGQVAYPVNVDPTFQINWSAGSTLMSGWQPFTTPRGNAAMHPTWQYSSPLNGATNGLGIQALAGQDYQLDDAGAWYHFAPGNPNVGDVQYEITQRKISPEHASWYRFDAGNVLFGYAPTQWYHDYNYVNPRFGFLDRTGRAIVNESKWQQQIGPGVDDYGPVQPGFISLLPNGVNGAGARFYLGPDANTPPPAPGGGNPDFSDNIVSFGMVNTNNTFDKPFTVVAMGWFRAYATDYTDPAVAAGPPGGWQKDTSVTVIARATDNGTGVESVQLKDGTTAVGTMALGPCPTSGQILCNFETSPANTSLPITATNLPEGRRTYSVVATDGGGRTATQSVEIAADREGPVITPSGPLFAEQNSTIRGGLTRSLTVTATDGDPNGGPAAQRSGVASIRVLVDGNEVHSKNQTAGGDSQSLTTTWTPAPGAFREGPHTVRIESVDRAGNPMTADEFTVTGGCCGTTAGQRPDDTLISDSLNQRTTYGVSVVTGNLLVSSKDVAITGLGGGTQLTRFYNSVHNGTQALHGDGFTTDLTGDVRVYDIDGSDDKSLRFGDGQVYRYKKKTDAAGYERPTEPSSLEADLEKETDGSYTLEFPRSKATWTFTSSGKLKSIEDNNDNKTTLDYTSTGILNKITDANGRDLQVTLNADNRIEKLQDISGREWIYSYGGAGNKYLTGYKDPTNGQTTYRYDAQNRLDRIVSPGGRAVRFTYTTDGPQDRIRTVVRETASNGTGPTWTFSYNASASQCEKPDKEQATVVTDPRGNATRYCITTETLRLKRAIDAKGRTRNVNFSPLGQVQDFTSGSGTGAATTTNTINGDNNVTNTADPEGEQSLADYATGSYRPTKSTDSETNERFYSFDNATGQLKSTRQKQSETDTQQASATLDYNDDGTLKTAKDGPGRTTTYTYYDGSKAGLVKTYDPPGPLNDVTFEYDQVGRRTKTTDGRGKVTTYQYDALDQNTKMTFDGGSTQTIVLDSDGNVTSRNDTVGGNYGYEYNALSQRTRDTFPGNRQVTYTYDAIGNLATLTDASGTTSYGYNEVNENCYVAPQTNNPSAACTSPPSGAVRLEYDSHGFPKLRKYPNGVDIDLEYDRSGKPKSVIAKKGSTVLRRREYSYETSAFKGKLIKRLDKGGQGVVNYTYDALGRLLTAQGGLPRSNGAAGDLSYTYDHAGNRKTVKCDADGQSSTVTYTYNDSNQMTGASKTGTICSLPLPATSFNYDGAGNDQRFTFNDRGQTTDMVGRTLGYAGADQRELITEGPDTIENTLLGEGRRLANGFLQFGAPTRYIRGLNGEIYARRTPTGTMHWYVQDAQGSVIGTTNGSGDNSETYDYDPDGVTPNKPPDFGYGGGYGSGAGNSWRYRFGLRWYDPFVARWTQPDALDQPGDLRQANRYSYVGGDPINSVDKSGAFQACIEVSVKFIVGGSVGGCVDSSAPFVHPTVSVGVGFGVGLNGSAGGGTVSGTPSFTFDRYKCLLVCTTQSTGFMNGAPQGIGQQSQKSYGPRVGAGGSLTFKPF